MTADRPAPAGRRRARAARPVWLAVLLVSLWIAGPANWPLWASLQALPEVHGVRGLLFTLAFAGLVAGMLALLFSLFAWRRSLHLVMAVTAVAAAVWAHFMGSYGVVMDTSMLQNVLQTDARETRDLLGVGLLLSVLLLAGPPLWWLWRAPIAFAPWPRQALRNLGMAAVAIAAIAALLLAAFQDLSATTRNHREVRFRINPLSAYWALGTLAYKAQARPSGPPTPIGLDARPAPRPAGARPPLVLLVIGETARADHFALNGYGRPTTPELARRDVLSFRDVSSCGTNTAVSLPCMVSAAGRIAHEARHHDAENLLDLLQRAGLAVLWIDNQSGCKGACDRVPHVDAEALAQSTPAALGLCPNGECFDAAMLHGLDARLAALPAERRARGTVIVLHQMGSHGPAYAQRSPPDRKPFQPECTSNALQQCEHQQLINAYDNSIAYTDHLLAGAIDWLGTQASTSEPALLYVSDHGESLGENNLYLHGLPYAVAPREQKHVPLIVWWPTQAARARPLDRGCLQRRLDEPLSHDNLFHTVLGLAQVDASEYRQPLDLLAPCRAAPPG